MTAAAESTPSLQREWWLRALAVFTSPRGTFAALSDDSPEAAEARQEPIMAIVILGGIAGVLSTSLAGRLLDDPNYDGLNVAVWAFLGGAFYGFLAFSAVLGGVVYWVALESAVTAAERRREEIITELSRADGPVSTE